MRIIRLRNNYFRDLWEDETQREVVLDGLKADCEIRAGRPPSL
jgi:hypothetical protein